MEWNEIKERIAEAELVLVGLGEEFDCAKFLKKEKENIGIGGKEWLLPAYIAWHQEEAEIARVRQALTNLAGLLEKKNYFVVSVSTNDLVREISWRQDRLVTPCGGSRRKSCSQGCAGVLEEVNREDKMTLESWFSGIHSQPEKEHRDPSLGCCPVCGSPLILNNIYAPSYNEEEYLADWQIYRKWLQGTVNRKLVILELGVGMKYPSVVRWPFEKMIFFNRKALFYRVNGTLHQMTAELKEQGTAIPSNAIDWLYHLC